MGVGVVDNLRGDGLAVGHLRLADVGVDFELTQHAVGEHIEVQLAHAAHDRLAGLFVGAYPKGWVFVGEGAEGLGHLVLIRLGLRLDRDVDNRLGEHHLFEDDRLPVIAQGVAGLGVLQTDSRADVAGVNPIDVFAFVGVHLQQATEALFLAGTHVENLIALVERARVDAEVGQSADVGIAHDLERQRGERLIVGRLAFDRLAFGGLAGHRRQINRRRQVVDDGVEQRLHALVLERGAVQDRHDHARRVVPVAQSHVVHVFGGDRSLRRRTSRGSFSSKVDSVSISSPRYGLGLHRACLRGCRSTSNLAPSSSPDHTTAFISTRSTMPL